MKPKVKTKISTQYNMQIFTLFKILFFFKSLVLFFKELFKVSKVSMAFKF